MRQKGKFLWMEVTLDETEQPVKVADTAQQLAYMCGISVHKIWDEYSKWTHGVLKQCRWRKVEIDDAMD